MQSKEANLKNVTVDEKLTMPLQSVVDITGIITAPRVNAQKSATTVTAAVPSKFSDTTKQKLKELEPGELYLVPSHQRLSVEKDEDTELRTHYNGAGVIISTPDTITIPNRIICNSNLVPVIFPANSAGAGVNATVSGWYTFGGHFILPANYAMSGLTFQITRILRSEFTTFAHEPLVFAIGTDIDNDDTPDDATPDGSNHQMDVVERTIITSCYATTGFPATITNQWYKDKPAPPPDGDGGGVPLVIKPEPFDRKLCIVFARDGNFGDTYRTGGAAGTPNYNVITSGDNGRQNNQLTTGEMNVMINLLRTSF